MTSSNIVRYNLNMKNWTSKEIKNLREKHNLSQPAFGNLLGVTGNYIYLLEKGVKEPSKTLRLLLGCVERQLSEIRRGGKENEKGKESDKKHGKRHL